MPPLGLAYPAFSLINQGYFCTFAREIRIAQSALRIFKPSLNRSMCESPLIASLDRLPLVTRWLLQPLRRFCLLAHLLRQVTTDNEGAEDLSLCRSLHPRPASSFYCLAPSISSHRTWRQHPEHSRVPITAGHAALWPESIWQIARSPSIKSQAYRR